MLFVLAGKVEIRATLQGEERTVLLPLVRNVADDLERTGKSRRNFADIAVIPTLTYHPEINRLTSDITSATYSFVGDDVEHIRRFIHLIDDASGAYHDALNASPWTMSDEEAFREARLHAREAVQTALEEKPL